MNVKYIALFLSFFLISAPNILAANPADEIHTAEAPNTRPTHLVAQNNTAPLDDEVPSSDHFVHSVSEEAEVQDTRIAIPIDHETDEHHSCMPAFDRVLGSTLKIIGAPAAIFGGVMTTVWSDPNKPIGQAGVAVLGIGGFFDRSGEYFLKKSRTLAAEMERDLDRHVSRLSNSTIILTEEEINELDAAFFAKSNRYQRYLSCTTKLDKAAGFILDLLGVPAALTGVGLTFSGDHPTAGPFLAASGAAAYNLAVFLNERAKTNNDQLKRIQAFKAAKDVAVARSRSVSSQTSAQSSRQISVQNKAPEQPHTLVTIPEEAEESVA